MKANSILVSQRKPTRSAKDMPNESSHHMTQRPRPEEKVQEEARTDRKASSRAASAYAIAPDDAGSYVITDWP